MIGLGGGLRGPRLEAVRSALRLLGDAGRRTGDLLRGDLGRGDLGRGDRGLGDLGRGDLGRGDRRVGERAILTQPPLPSYPVFTVSSWEATLGHTQAAAVQLSYTHHFTLISFTFRT